MFGMFGGRAIEGRLSASSLRGVCFNVGGGATRRLLCFWSEDKNRGVAAPPTLKWC
jgi:hypothetical protein